MSWVSAPCRAVRLAGVTRSGPPEPTISTDFAFAFFAFLSVDYRTPEGKSEGTP
jgi:hypothetical protein